MTFDLGNYVDVAERLAALKEKHPDASLQPLNPAKPYDVVTIGEATFIVYAAVCHRGPNDRRPGIALAWEPFPGKTPYTKDSELQNAETSAWGRAIVAALAADTRRGGVASADEVRNRRSDEDAPPPERDSALDEQTDRIKARIAELDDDHQALLKEEWRDAHLANVEQCTAGQLLEAAALVEKVHEYAAGTQALELAGRPCELCDSTRTKRALVGLGADAAVRCVDATGCEKRVAEHAADQADADDKAQAPIPAGQDSGS